MPKLDASLSVVTLGRHMKPLAALSQRLPWPHASLRTYLVAAMLLATVPIALLMAWQIVSSLKAQQVRQEESLVRSVASLTQSVERELASSIDSLTILSQSETLQRGDFMHFKSQLVQRKLLRPSWASAYLVDASGAVLFDTADPDGAAGERQAVTRTYLEVLLAGTPRVSGLVGEGASGGDPPRTRYATAIEVPVQVNGQPYVLGAWIDAAVWQDLIDTATAPAEGFINLYDANHRVIARTLAPQRYVGQTLPQRTIDIMAGRPSGVGETVMLGGGGAYAAWQTLPDSRWGLAVGMRAQPIDARQREAIAAAIITAGGCLLLGVTLALWLARRVTDPLHQLARRGGASPLAPIPVHEIALLRDALLGAQLQDELARARLKAKADEFETLFDSSPIGLAFAQDPQCRVVLHNAAMTALFGPPPDTGGGLAVVEVLHRGKVLERHEQPLQLAAAQGQAVNGMELEIRIAGRPPTFVIAHAVPLTDLAGLPRGALGAVVDISERKEAEARLFAADHQLRESQRLVDLAQEAGHVGFFNYRFATDELAWTPGQAKLFGIEADVGEGPFKSSLDAWVDRIDPSDRAVVEQALRRMFAARQETETLEFRVPGPDGAPDRWLSSRLLMSYGEDGRPLQLVGITLDMTEQKALERERAALVERAQAARLEAEASNRAKDEFLAMLGHELRNPLSAITAAAELLNRVEAQTEIALSARAIITRQTRHLARLMDDLLDVGRVISGKILLSRQPLDLSALVQRHASTVELTGNAARHRITLAVAEAWVDADPTRMEQIVNNLLTNAIKYTPEGGAIEVRVRREGADAVLEVKDNGVGIAPNLLPRIFELFVQGERTLDRRAGGLGVGLTLVKRLVELHGGEIMADSELGRGSTFRVRLPAVEAPAGHKPRHIQQPAECKRVLVVEDNEDALAALRSMLELDGHRVATQADGNAGLATLLAERPDVAIVDIGLPGLTGYEVAKRSRAAGHAGRMIAISGYGQPQDVRRSLQAGFDAHLVKPVAAEDLQRLMAEP